MGYMYYYNNVREHSSLDYQTPFAILKKQMPDLFDSIRYTIPILLDDAAVNIGPWSGYNVLAHYLNGWQILCVFYIIHFMVIQNQEDGFLEIPHSADLALQVWAASLSGLFIQAAKGMYSLSRIIENHAGSEVFRKMELQEIDFENLLVSFLNELLNDLQQNGKVYDQFHLEINHLALIGDLTGKKISGVGREIKAVTYHNLKIVKKKSGYQTTIVFDI